MKSALVKRVFVEVKRPMREKLLWRAETMALLMCSPIRPVPPIMRMLLFGVSGMVMLQMVEAELLLFSFGLRVLLIASELMFLGSSLQTAIMLSEVMFGNEWPLE